ncbi:hypothetical protein L1987_33077 [Smallanthus sonchifolius]|uniref:Uncharacterized protein n=1 Tax=Smallanthus sonchifolius TaxID=185202 RepID=A0ACB9HPJ4_9ASTR|nr:hypothetical protein L1987_33077 [Smallanthus sonchifolius]
MLEQVLKKLAAQGKSSCRKDTLRHQNDDDEDPNVGIGRGCRRQGKWKVAVSGELEGDKDEGDKIECLIDLDDVFIEDWKSEDKIDCLIDLDATLQDVVWEEV